MPTSALPPTMIPAVRNPLETAELAISEATGFAISFSTVVPLTFRLYIGSLAKAHDRRIPFARGLPQPGAMQANMTHHTRRRQQQSSY